MRKHIIVLASVFIVSGMFLGSMFIYGHLEFLSAASGFQPESSALDGSFSFLNKLGSFITFYFDWFGQFGINPLISLFVIVTSFLLGYGLLKSKDWARKLGFLIIFINTFSSLYAVLNGFASLTAIVQLGLCAYMWWVLASDEAKSLLQNKLN